MKFENLHLADAIVRAVHEQGYENPTPIQAQAIPVVLAGHDLLGGAQTGTGKTAAFVLPMLQRLSTDLAPRPSGSTGHAGIRALVLTPTRELAAQVQESVQVYGKYLKLSSAVIFGGVGMGPQISRLQKGVDILVATPGRLLDLMQQGAIDLGAVQILVLDEADRMLDMGFIHDVKKVLAAVPRDKQSLLFSATFSDEIRELAATLLQNPQSVQVTPGNTTVQRITQVIYPVGRSKKKALLAHIILQHNWSQVLVFTRTKFGANNVADHLCKNGVKALALHGNKSQTARTQALSGFKSGDIRVLVATDIAARGIDIDDLPHVVNYDIPNVCEDYVHRIGRTGRAGADGMAVNLVCLDEEGFMQAIERFTGQEIPVQIMDGFMPDPDEKAQPIAMGRQTIWGGAGRPPSQEVMQAASRAARAEMLQRMRDSKGADRPNAPRSPRGPRPQGAPAARPSSTEHRAARPSSTEHRAARPSSSSGGGKGRSGRMEGGGDYAQPHSHLTAVEQAVRGPAPRFGRETGGGGQPDPMRTSVDIMAGKGSRRSGGNTARNTFDGFDGLGDRSDDWSDRGGVRGNRPTGAGSAGGNKSRAGGSRSRPSSGGFRSPYGRG